MTKFTDEVVATYTLPVMNLKVTVGGEEKEFTSPVAETILHQIREINRLGLVGKSQIQYFDTDENKFVSFTYCCGDKYEFSFTTKEVEALATELDCYGFPVTYDADNIEGELPRYKTTLGGTRTYKDHLQDVRAKQFGTSPAVESAIDDKTKPSTIVYEVEIEYEE